MTFCSQINKNKNPMFRSESAADTAHEYHEISDDEGGDKFDLGPSLLDEMDLMFRSMNLSNRYQHENSSQDIDGANKKNELTEFTSKLHGKNGNSYVFKICLFKKIYVSARWTVFNRFITELLTVHTVFIFFVGSVPSKSKKKMALTVRPISVKDEKILNQAIDFANEISAR